MTVGLIDDKQGGFRSGMGCVNLIFTLKQIGEKPREKKRRVKVDFMNLEKAYDRVQVQVKIMWSVVGRWQLGGKFQVLLGPCLMLEVCRLSVLGSCMRNCSCLFLYMVERH